MDTKKIAEEIFLAGVKSVLPAEIINKSVQLEKDILVADKTRIDLSSKRFIYIIGAGKASSRMALEMETLLGDRISDGLVITKYNHSAPTSRVRTIEAGHPVPDKNGYDGTVQLLKIAKNARKDDLVIVLLSGGGSALLTDFPPGSTLDDLKELNEVLIKSGADIREINTIRKHLSGIKGGQLAATIFPAEILCLILSDVVGDSLNVIASGPTVPDPATFGEAIDIIEKYSLENQVPVNLYKYLLKGINKEIRETPKTGDKIFSNVHNVIIGNNRIAINAASQKASGLGFNCITGDSSFEGDPVILAEQFVSRAIKIREDNKIKKPACLLFGGESSLKVRGTGKGGRNQHMALQALLSLNGRKGITFLAAGTDGTDGPTDAAGAVINSSSISNPGAEFNNAQSCIERFDSYNFFKNNGGHIITGPTYTNVMDIVIIIIE